MSKRIKDIEVHVEEERVQYNRANALTSKLSIGKKEIGRVIPQNGKKFITETDGKQEGTVKDLDEAFETVTRQRNLSE